MSEQIPQVAVEAAVGAMGGHSHEAETRVEIARLVLAAALPSLTAEIRGPVEAELKEAKDSLSWAMEYIDEPEPTEEPGNHAKFHAALATLTGEVDEAESSEGITGVEYWKSRAEEAERDLADTDWSELLDAAMEAGQKKGVPLKALRDRLDGAS